MKKIWMLMIPLIFIHWGCIEEVELPYRNLEPKLVVDGEVTNEAPPYNLRLSYSGKFVSGDIITSRLAVNGAKVVMTDNLNNIIPFKQNIFEPALYQTDTKYQCQIGRSYSLKIELPDGKIYVTAPQLLKPVVPIVNIYADKIKNFMRFYIDTQDSKSAGDFYRWKGFSISLKLTSGGNSPSDPGNGNGTCLGSCWTYNTSSSANVYTDKFINGNFITKKLVFFSPIDSDVPLSRHYAEIRQMSVSEEAYLFWTQYEEQRTRTGSIFDPLPSTIIGNIVNLKDDKDFALGFFGVSAVNTKRLRVEPDNFKISTEPSVGLAPPSISTRSSGNCETTFPSYGCKPPEIWE